MRLRDEGCLVAALDINTCALANLPDMVLPLAADDPRYLSPRDFTPRVDIQGDGLWADVSGSLSIQETGPAEVRLLAVAFDSNGNPVGFRRWDDPSPLSGGSPREFSLTVYSAGPPISRVEVIAEIIIEPATPTTTPTP